jgi:hypothetical protein
MDLISLSLVFVIIIFFVIIIIDNTYQSYEHYDAKIQNISLSECGTRCTNGRNCTAFAYKPVDNTCYLSQTGILGKPYDSLYSDDYSKLDKRCNKINKLTDSKRIDGNTLTQNSIYLCSEGEKNTVTEFQFANLGASAIINDIPDSVKYEVYDISYPKEKIDSNIIAETPYQTPYKNPDIKTSSSFDNSNNEYGFIESNNEFLGQYLLAHQCVVNVPLYDCLKYCENNSECVGTEWNKILFKDADNKQKYMYQGVCCPKTIIKKIIPRNSDVSDGRFYIKKKLSDLIQRDKIILTKADFNSPLTNDDKQFNIEI